MLEGNVFRATLNTAETEVAENTYSPGDIGRLELGEGV